MKMKPPTISQPDPKKRSDKMNTRKQFRLSDEAFNAILEIARTPSPVIFLSGGKPMGPSTQDRANEIWQAEGKRLGFAWDTAEPAGTGDPKDFTALAIN